MSLLSFFKRSKPQTKHFMQRSYSAGTTDRLVSNLFGSSGGLSMNSELYRSLIRIRARARELEQNSPHTNRFLDIFESSVIGSGGITLQMKARDISGELDNELNTRVEELWAEWGLRENASAARCLSWVEIQRLVLRTMLRDGEVFLRRIRGGNDFNFGLQILEADFCDINANVTERSGRKTVMGISFNTFGEAQAYFMFLSHPGDTISIVPQERRQVWVSSSEIIHVFRCLRPGQIRGVSALAPVMIKLHHLNEYAMSELISSRIQSCTQGFYTQDKDSGAEYSGDTQDESGELMQEFTPGVFTKLPPGTDAKILDPTRPASNYSNYVKTVVAEVAAGLGLSYSSLSTDGSSENYSSMRQMSLLERDIWRSMQSHFIDSVCRPVFKSWVEMAALSGLIKATDAARIIRGAVWRGKSWPWIDPMKDMRAAAESVALGVRSRTEIIADAGGDMEETFKQLAGEQRLAEELGLSIGPMSPQPGESSKEPTEEEAVAES